MRFTFDQFCDFTAPLEGGFSVRHMFMVQDLQVATGMGITFGKDEGLAAALRRKWVYKTGHARQDQPCDPADVIKDYKKVLSMTDEGNQGGGGRQVWRDATQCRITESSLRDAVKDMLDSNILNLKTRFSQYFSQFEDFPADAQLAVASVTWGIGANFPKTWVKLSEACRDIRWDGNEAPPKWVASKQCTFKSAIGTQITRCRAQVDMFHNAAMVQAGIGKPEILYWPQLLYRGPGDFEVPDRFKNVRDVRMPTTSVEL